MAVDDSYTKSLLHFDTDLTDESGKIWTPYGGSAVSSAWSKFGGKSLFCVKGIETPYTSDFDVGSGNFTVDMQLNIPNSNDAILFDIGATNSMYFYLSGGKLAVYSISGTVAVNQNITNGSHHIAVIKYNGYMYVAVDGILSNGVVCGSIPVTTIPVSLGCASGHYSGYDMYFFKGYIDEFRFSKGIARWTTNFTPPTSPYGATATPKHQCMTGGM